MSKPEKGIKLNLPNFQIIISLTLRNDFAQVHNIMAEMAPSPTLWFCQIVNGDVCKITNEDAILRMNDESPSWKN